MPSLPLLVHTPSPSSPLPTVNLCGDDVVVLCGGRGACSVVGGILDRPNTQVSLVVNAYDNGHSTGRIRRLFNILGPSDTRKGMATLLDRRRPEGQAAAEFMVLRFGNEDEDDNRQEERIVRAMANGDDQCLQRFRKGQVFLRLGPDFRALVSSGCEAFLGHVDSGLPDLWPEMNLMNLVIAGLSGPGGDICQAIARLQGALPMRGQVLVNSPRNRYLYGLREFCDPNDPDSYIMDEGAIVSQRSSARIDSLHLLAQPLGEKQLSALAALPPEQARRELVRLAGPAPEASPEVLAAIRQADAIIYGPGTQHSSLLPTYMTAGLANEIVRNTRARKILLTNIGEDLDTRGYTAHDVFRTAVKHLAAGTDGTPPPDAIQLVTDVLVNRPSRPDSSTVQPALRDFQAFGCEVYSMRDRGKDQQPTGAASFPRVIFDAVEGDPAGTHDAAKTGGIVNRLLSTGHAKRDPIAVRLSAGAVLCDVDQTILDVRFDTGNEKFEESLLEAPVRRTIVELLQCGFQFVAVTGNDLCKLKKRFIDPLAQALRERGQLGLIEQFEAYGNGAASHITCTVDGDKVVLVDDESYNARYRIPDEDWNAILSAANTACSQVSIPAPDELWSEGYSSQMWKYRYEPTTGEWFSDAQETDDPIPWVQCRGDQAMITVKPLPSDRHRETPCGLPSIRSRVLEKLEEALRDELGERADLYVVSEGGMSSLDIARYVCKAHAVNHYLHRHRLHPQDVIYFGNEIRHGGNDRCVAAIPGIHVVAVNQPERQIEHLPNVFYGGGRGTASTMQQFGDILETYHENMLRARQNGIPAARLTPVLLQKAESLCLEARTRRESTLAALGETTFERLARHQSHLQHLGCSLKIRRGPQAHVIIAAAGKGTRFGASQPKPLVPVLGRPSICHPIEAFLPFASRTTIVVREEDKGLFEAELAGYGDRTMDLVAQSGGEGDWRAIWSALQAEYAPEQFTIVAWGDLAVLDHARIREAMAIHIAQGNAMTIPTAFEANPYTRILRDANGEVAELVLRDKDRDREGAWEHDCSFFLFDTAALRSGLEALARMDEQSPGNVRFVDIVSVLVADGHTVRTAPICSPTDFRGFNEIGEWSAIERTMVDG